MSAASDTEGLVTIAMLGIGGYLLYQLIQGIGKVGGAAGAAATAAGNAAGGALYQALNPNAAGSAATLIATMPDGTKTAFAAESVSPSGQVTIGNQTYQVTGSTAATRTVAPVLDPTASDDLDADFSAGNY